MAQCDLNMYVALIAKEEQRQGEGSPRRRNEYFVFSHPKRYFALPTRLAALADCGNT